MAASTPTRRRPSPYQVVKHGLKLCSKCSEWRPLPEFPKVKTTSTGRAAACADCHLLFPSQRGEIRRAVTRREYERNGRRRDLAKLYGITPEQYDEMAVRQGGVCAICGDGPSPKRRLVVDHNHETGAVRGLLCANCNAGVGLLGDDPATLLRAVAYLDGGDRP